MEVPLDWNRFLRVHAIASSIALITLLGMGAAGRSTSGAPEEELSVRRLNVIDSEGRIRVQIAGDFAPRRAMLSGILFHNEEGNEAGGLVYYGKTNDDGSVSAGGILTFDQYRDDQIMALEYSQHGTTKRNGLRFMDRPDEMSEPLAQFYRDFEAAETEEERQRLRQEVLPTIPAEDRPQQRLFVGRDASGRSILKLSDAQGLARIQLTVEADGGARIEFLDDDGNVTREIAP